jgi:hypothetical protein
MIEEGRRDRLCVQALDPENRHSCIIQISHERLLTVAKWGAWAVREAAELVPFVLQHPVAVFQGLRRDSDEDPGGTGWRCYSGSPAVKFAKDGSESNPEPNQVFLVFVNDEGVAYNWRWEPAALEAPGFPRGYDTRFKETMYHEADD